MPLKDAIATVMNRNAFYRDGYRLLMRISLLQGVIIVLLGVAIASMILTMETRYVYFATTADGRIINIVPLSEPYRSNADVLTWTARAARDSMQFNYSDFRQRLEQASSNFTVTGKEAFLKALTEANILKTVEARKALLSIELEAAPEIIRDGVSDGVYTWKIKMPVVIRFEGQEVPGAQRALLLLTVVRVSTLQNPDGISIEQWIARPYN